MLRIFAAAALMFFCLSSCDNDLEVLGPYEENMIVYGLLNSADSAQYIRVNKVFVNPDNDAMEIAKISDSLFYDSLNVYLQNLTSGVITTLTKETGIPKDPGVFANDVNILYKYSVPLDPQANYKLTVVNPVSQKTVTAFTNIVAKVNVQAPKDSNTILNISPSLPMIFKFTSGLNSKIIDVQATVYYDEMQKSDTNQRVVKKVTWKIFTSLLTSNTNGGQDFNMTVNGDQFFQTMVNGVPVSSDVLRRITKIDFNYYSGSDELNTYMSVNKPSIGIVQKKPEYSNIEGALGLFTSRNTTIVKSVKFNAETKARLANYPGGAARGFVP